MMWGKYRCERDMSCCNDYNKVISKQGVVVYYELLEGVNCDWCKRG